MITNHNGNNKKKNKKNITKFLYCKLNYQIINLAKNNPHTTQYFCNYNNTFLLDKNFRNKKFHGIIKPTEEVRLFEGENIYAKVATLDNYYSKTYTRIINNSFPRLKYEDLAHKLTTVIHWGQRKLLLSEIEFLTKYAQPNDVLIYAGAAPGDHIILLNQFFPFIYYVLIDPRDFSKGLKGKDNIRLLNTYLDKKISADIKKQFAGRRLLLISDIRRDEPTQENIQEDMSLQRYFYKIMDPDYSMFKFRLRYDTGKTTYMKGLVYIQPWARVSSSEGRLVIEKNAEEIEYDNQKYEENFVYFSRIMRCQYFKHNYQVPDMDHCYDCYTEFYILGEYYDKYGDKFLKNLRVNNKNTRKKFVENSSKYITKELIKYTKNHFILDYNVVE